VTGPSRVLFAIAVYNGREFIDRTLASASRFARDGVDVDVMVFDDASPSPGFSEHVAARCETLGLSYYRSPRNQGLVRNLNLAMRWSMRAGYDYLVLANSDVIYPADLVTGLVGAAQSAPDVGAVVSWSNNMAAFTLHNPEADIHLASQEAVDYVSTTLAGEFADTTIELPCGVGFCWMMPVPVIERIGIQDTIFDRGYCEETDWTLRARAAGYRVLLAPGVFSYHQGNVSMLDAGVLQDGEITVDKHEAIVDERYPDFRQEVEDFADSEVLDRVAERAVRALARRAASERGYEVEVGWLTRPRPPGSPPHCQIHPGDTAAHVEISHLGFSRWVYFDDGDGPKVVRDYFGADPSRVTIRDIGPQADLIERTFREAGVPIERHVNYQQAVLI
jgi:GT2 family glycosyltransferase